MLVIRDRKKIPMPTPAYVSQFLPTDVHIAENILFPSIRALTLY